MSNKKIIDIVIPVFNEEKYLSKCLDSVLKFKIPDNIDIIIYLIDGNSTDQTKNIVLSYTKIYNNIIYVFNERKIRYKKYFNYYLNYIKVKRMKTCAYSERHQIQ